MKLAVVRNDTATARLVILLADHTLLFARELGQAHRYRVSGESRSFRLRCPGRPFRDDVEGDNVTDRGRGNHQVIELDEL